VNFELGTTLGNSGEISGGDGGSGSSGAGGAGAAGVNLLTGTLTNTGSIAGGAGGAGSAIGGDGGAGVFLNGGMLVTSGTLAGGAGGSGTSAGAAGDAVTFGTASSILVVDPGAQFDGQVVAANSRDVLELAGIQSGGTPISLGTQFTGFSTLEFDPGALWTVEANVADLTLHPLTIDGFVNGDKLDITDLAKPGATLSFNTTTEVLTLTNGATTINLQFNSAFAGRNFVLNADGHGGTNVRLQPGAGATLTALSHDGMNFVSDEHRALLGEQWMSMFGTHSVGSGLTQPTDPALLAFGGHGGSANVFSDHGIAHASVIVR
jgi:hypothetical protein